MGFESAPPPRESCLVVFAQRGDARIDLAAWSQHAERFFATKLALTAGKHYSDVPPRVDAVAFVLTRAGAPAATRLAFARPRDAEDLALAEAAEARTGHTGLVLLARRCPMVWQVPKPASGDAEALRLAAILASVLLGPILDVAAAQLFGVKTARAKLES
jgi:hypothetical protein